MFLLKTFKEFSILVTYKFKLIYWLIFFYQTKITHYIVFIQIFFFKHFVQLISTITFYRKFKTKRWWCQSFLAGVDTILCGFRNDDGIVEKLKVYKLDDLPKMSQVTITELTIKNYVWYYLDVKFIYESVMVYKKNKIQLFYGNHILA